MIGICFVRVHTTTVSLHAALGDRQFLEDILEWPGDDMEKSTKALSQWTNLCIFSLTTGLGFARSPEATVGENR